MLEYLTKALIAYLLGTLMGGSLVGRLRGGVDLRQLGSGNLGTTNALRTQGLLFAALVLLIDAGKGALAALAVPALPWPWPEGAAGSREALAYACGFSAALGHCYPLWFRFKGGKGVATMAGVVASLLPGALLLMLPAFALVVLVSGYVSLASVTAAWLALPYVAWLQDGSLAAPGGVFALGLALLVSMKHRSNLRRIRSGSEHRFRKAMLLRRRSR